MIHTLLRGLAAAALTVLPLAAPAHAAATSLPLGEAVERLPLAIEDRTRYDRDLFKHWNTGLRRDGCDTRKEVLIHETLEPLEIGPRCRLTGGG
jgi:hypothetical protein